MHNNKFFPPEPPEPVSPPKTPPGQIIDKQNQQCPPTPIKPRK